MADRNYLLRALRSLPLAVLLAVGVCLLVDCSRSAWAQPPADPDTPPPAAPATPSPTVPATPSPAAPATQPGAAPAEAAAPAEKAPPSYINFPLDGEIEKQQMLKRFQINRMLAAGAFTAGQEQEFRAYYDTFTLARWKDLSKAHLLTDFRKDLTNELRMGKSGAVHDLLIGMAMDTFTPMTKENYHAAVRYNAMLMIGDLNQRDTTSVTEKPVPLPAALPLLLEAINDQNQIAAVKVAALRGIIRHVTLGIADLAVRDEQVVPALLKLATAKVQVGRSAEGQGWVRALAIEGLAAAGVFGDQNDPASVPKALAAIVAEQEAQPLTRCAAARALGKFRYPAGLGLDPVAVAAALGKLAAESCTMELERAEKEAPVVAVAVRPAYPSSNSEMEEQEEAPVDDPAGGLFGGPRAAPVARPNAPAAAVDTGSTVALRRRLKAKLEAVWEGLAGEDPTTSHIRWTAPEGGVRTPTAGVSLLATAPNQQTYVDHLLAQLKNVMDLCDNKDSPQSELVEKIQADLALLNQTIAKVPAAAPADQPAAAQ